MAILAGIKVSEVFFMAHQEIMRTIRMHDDFLLSHGVSKMGIFGSQVRGDQHDGSDIDLIVEFEEGKKNYDNFIELCFFLEDLFGKKIDLLTAESISPFMRATIDQEVHYETIH
jgi:predicted nucleotidyltransferase